MPDIRTASRGRGRHWIGRRHPESENRSFAGTGTREHEERTTAPIHGLPLVRVEVSVSDVMISDTCRPPIPRDVGHPFTPRWIARKRHSWRTRVDFVHPLISQTSPEASCSPASTLNASGSKSGSIDSVSFSYSSWSLGPRGSPTFRGTAQLPRQSPRADRLAVLGDAHRQPHRGVAGQDLLQRDPLIPAVARSRTRTRIQSFSRVSSASTRYFRSSSTGAFRRGRWLPASAWEARTAADP